MANTSKKSFFKLTNNTKNTAELKVSNIDNNDWDGNSRPDHNLNGRIVNPMTNITEREELNANATSRMFTLQVHFKEDDGTANDIHMRIDQGIAIGGSSWMKDITSTICRAAGAVAGTVIGGGGAMGRVVGTEVGTAIGNNITECFAHSEAGTITKFSQHYTVDHYVDLGGSTLEVVISD